MRFKVTTSLFLAVFCIIPFVNAQAVPAQRQVTVVNSKDQVIFKDYIRYNNTYTQPKVIIPKPAPTKTPAKTSAVPVARSDNNDARMAVKYAYELIGSSYVYGANGPNSFDCSGFTMYVYKKLGYNLPHLASAQYNCGAKISRDQLVPGDLLFFGYYGSSGIDHVGLYVGNGLFIHASSSKRKVVETSINDSYYLQNYKGAARIIR